MRARTDPIHLPGGRAHRAGRLASPIGCALRDLAVRVAPARVERRQHERVFGPGG